MWNKDLPVMIKPSGYKGLAIMLECSIVSARRKVKRYNITKYAENHQVIRFSVAEVYEKVVLRK